MISSTADAIRTLFNTGYSFLTGIIYPGLTVTPLVILLSGSAVIVAIRWFRKTISEV